MKKAILITGATSGLGYALAKAYASSDVILYLTGRNAANLAEISNICRSKGAIIYSKVIDITVKEDVDLWYEKVILRNGLDMVISNAGISTKKFQDMEDAKLIKKVFDVNVGGVFNTILPAISHFKQKKSGHVVIISSLAGYRGLASCPAYSSSKAAVKIYGEALRGNLSNDNIDVTVVTPGFVKTAMTACNDFYMPFLMEADKAADIIVKRLKSKPARIAFPFIMYFITWLFSVIPAQMSDYIFKKFMDSRRR